ncbi:PP2C family protein-serine/threonine phosphatase [Sphingomonas mesophila]|uniref:PP2C family protein-serine/threonine phosphatase n=1 Tax=Sphingomonas mesophila TaxID=2303576 RepID=UPI000E57F647|nr:protein phosphatase 2C domain-containing protein [Sphingomonas mesophila]
MSKCWACTHVGHRRESNEDTVEVSSRNPHGKLHRWRGYVSNNGGWALVADGMGGHAAGEVASELALELLRPVMHRLEDEGEVTSALNAVNDGLFEAMARNPALYGMGTTIAGVVLRGTEALAFNVGDSRIYMFSEGKLTRLSIDHVIDGHVLTQCLGGYSGAPLKPHARRFRLEPYSKLMICSDGLTDLVSDDEIAGLLSGHSGAFPALRLTKSALKAGGDDNISVVVFEIDLDDF